MYNLKKLLTIVFIVFGVSSSVIAKEEFLVWTPDDINHTALTNPHDVVIADDGSMYVTTISSVKKLDSDGRLVLEWGKYYDADIESGNDGEFSDIQGLSLDSLGNIYVTDGEGKRVQKFDSNGNFLSKWGNSGTGEGEFAYLMVEKN